MLVDFLEISLGKFRDYVNSYSSDLIIVFSSLISLSFSLNELSHKYYLTCHICDL